MTSNVRVTKTYQASADQLWKAIGDPTNISEWHPAIASSGGEDGSRTCVLEGGGEVVEKILSHDDSRRRYQYSIVSSPLPIENYVSTISVEETGAGCEVVWDSTFEVVGAPPADVEAAIRGLYEAGLSKLATTFGAGS